MNISLPPVVAQLLAELRAAGHSAYVVGGCVRDSLLGRTPGDWDICTAATPDEMKEIFAADELVLTGEKHGTVAVVRGGRLYEMTTYRLDGTYSDDRHPDSVAFVPDVRLDLARRDFTVNAMAWAPSEGLVDAFGGQADLAAGVLRCVGEPEARFGEDALRILRALRFAAQLDFVIEKNTAAAALALRDTVQNIAAERVFTELDKMLAGPAAGRVLAGHGAVLAGVIPEIEPCIGCTQGPGHIGDVWRHTAAAVGAVTPRLVQGLDAEQARAVRWTMLLHDLAKPACRSVDGKGRIRFRGHNARGARQAQRILARLKAPGVLLRAVPSLTAIHDIPLPADDAGVLRLLARYGPQMLEELCAVKQADLAAHANTHSCRARRAEVNAFAAKLAALAPAGCYRVDRLKVNGGDVLAAGIGPGPAVGQALRDLLEQVMDGTLPNERAALLAALGQTAQKPPAKGGPQG